MKLSKQALVELRNRLPLPLQRSINRLAFHCLIPKHERQLWDDRLHDALACKDNLHIPRHPQAGKVSDGLMTMHNGMRLHAGSYYGYGSQRILEQNKGCHEPQEERVFAQVLSHLAPGSVMLELGAYWAFYSLWFATTVPQAINVMVEPDAGNLAKGRMNFELNQRPGTFLQGFVGAQNSDSPAGKTFSVDGIIASQSIERLHLLHCDIQGYEHDMLHGAAQLLSDQRIDYLFISTHSNELHRDCVEHLRSHSYRIVQSIDLDETYSHDGLIVAQRPGMTALPELQLDKKPKAQTTR